MPHSTRLLLALAALASCLPARASAQIHVIGSTVLERAARPGETYTGTFAVENTTGEPQEARLYQTDYASRADGSRLYGDPGSTPRSNARWITFSPAHLVIPPHGRAEVAYSVAVPADARAESGSWWSMLMVEVVPHGAPRSRVVGRHVALGIEVKVRYAVQLVTDLGAGAGRQVRISAAHVESDSAGHHALAFDLENDGDLAYPPAVEVQLFDAAGRAVADLRSRREVLYPGSALRERIGLPGRSRGEYRALVIVDAGDNAVFGAQFRLVL